jgi:DNA-binding CsgD family transcriptional regulator
MHGNGKRTASAQKKSEAELYGDLLKEMLTHVQMSIVVLDEDYKIMYCNQNARNYADRQGGRFENEIQTLCGEIVSELWMLEAGDGMDRLHQYALGDKRYSAGLLPFVAPMRPGKFKTFFFLYFSPEHGSSKSDFGEDKNRESYLLSRREVEVLHLIADGCGNREIAEKLNISVHTVKTHNENIFRKLETGGRTAAVNKFFKWRKFERKIRDGDM